MNAIEFLNRLKWNPKYKFSEYTVVILHRGAPNDRKEISCSNIELGRTFFSTKTTRIPAHRIIEIKRGKKVVWKR